MRKKSQSIVLILIITVLSIGIIKCITPLLSFDLNKEKLENKLSYICTKTFERDFDVEVVDIQQDENRKVKVYFQKNLQEESKGEVILIKTIFNRYSMIKMQYWDIYTNYSYENPLKNSYFTIIRALLIILVLVYMLARNKSV